MKKQQICILGSTGSIGTQALDVIEQHSDLYEVYCLTANNRVQELAEQARKFHPICLETLFMDQTFLKQNCRHLYKSS